MRTSPRRTDVLRARVALLAVPVAEPPAPFAGPAAAVDTALEGLVARAARDGEVRGRKGELTIFHTGGRVAAPRVAVVGLGKQPDAEAWRAAGAAVARRAGATGAATIGLALPDDAPLEAGAWFAEGAWWGSYRLDRFRTKKESRHTVLRELVVLNGDRSSLATADALMTGVLAARELADTPGNVLTPTALADAARALAAELPGLSCRVLGERELARLGAGGLLGVAAGSAQQPRMIVMRYRPRGARRGEVLGLVGKAVTFDSGGISIKPAAGMEEMKLDMGGGAAVIQGIGVMARLGIPLEALAVVPATENMPSGSALKPGDVITAMNGTTIEVTNTDAEGRLILADGLVYATRNGATRLLDIATLTGAMVVALGDVYAGLFGNDPDWTELVRDAGEASGDIVWPMPLHDGYRPLIRSRTADLSNAAKKRQAGAVYAAMFLQEFASGLPWCHVDIAGTGMKDGGGTGFGVRLIAALADRLAAGGKPASA
ncbi:MAG TPA: leucyl aminopeptidase [Miltoncostaeaceae bacterium]|nr:leucyl aminopeptidase [Miltoncostaeaceae bacterium]